MHDSGLLRFRHALHAEVWALHPTVLAELCQAALDAQLPAALRLQSPTTSTALEVRQGTALIPITGLLEKQLSYLGWLHGATLFPLLQAQLREAGQRADVRRVLLLIDSPGGTVAGTQETASLLRELGAVKPVIAHGSGMVASAAYWLAAQAHRLLVTPSTEVGSVGIVATHTDASALEAKLGITFTEISSGPFKRIASMHAPLTSEGRAYLQAQVDTAARLFAREVQAGRQLTEDQMTEIRQAKTYFGAEAQAVGLVDQLAHFDQVLGGLTAGDGPAVFLPSAAEAVAAAGPEGETPALEESSTKEEPMSLSPPEAPHSVADLQRQYPELCQQLSTEATTAERERIRRIGEIAPPMLAAKAREYQFEQPLSAEAASYELLKLQQQGKADQLAALQRESPPILPRTDTPTGALAPSLPVLSAEQAEVNKQLGLTTADYLKYADGGRAERS
jgi:signal peptide peptidase SppA